MHDNVCCVDDENKSDRAYHSLVSNGSKPEDVYKGFFGTFFEQESDPRQS